MDLRASNGQFAAGNSGGPGRPKGSLADYLAAIRDGVSPDDWAAIVAKAVADARDGNRHARQWISNYVIGRAPLKVEMALPGSGDVWTASQWDAFVEQLSDDEIAVLQGIRARMATSEITVPSALEVSDGAA